MPLLRDPEYEKAISKIASETLRDHIGHAWWLVVAAASLLSAFIVGMTLSGFTGSVLIASTTALSTVCLIVIIREIGVELHTSLVVLVGVTEWVGRKQLGEYEKE